MKEKFKIWRRELRLKLQRRFRQWLGLGDAFMGVDIGFRDQSAIVVVSRLNDGTVKIIDCKFGSIVEIERLAAELQGRYGILRENIVRDYPLSARSRKRGYERPFDD